MHVSPWAFSINSVRSLWRSLAKRSACPADPRGSVVTLVMILIRSRAYSALRQRSELMMFNDGLIDIDTLTSAIERHHDSWTRQVFQTCSMEALSIRSQVFSSQVALNTVAVFENAVKSANPTWNCSHCWVDFLRTTFPALFQFPSNQEILYCLQHQPQCQILPCLNIRQAVRSAVQFLGKRQLSICAPQMLSL